MKRLLSSIQPGALRRRVELPFLLFTFLLVLLFTVAISANASSPKLQELPQVANGVMATTGMPYLDKDFGVQGIVITSINEVDQANDIVVQTDGRLIVVGITRPSFSYVGDQLLVRYLADGSLDTTFGSGGVVITPLSSEYDIANGVTLQSDNKIITAGGSSQQGWLTVARYNEDGTLDNLFGQGAVPGVVTATIGTEAWANDVVLQPDGDIVAAGGSIAANITSFALVRFLESGMLDTSFGTQGITTTLPDAQSTRSIAYDVALQSDGKILVAGYDDRDNDRALLVRYNANGTLDTTFGSGGIIAETFGTAARFWALDIQPDGKILAAGELSGSGMLLTRYNADGTLDTTFAGDGIFTMSEYGFPGKTISDIALFDDGKIVAGGVEGEPGISAQQVVVVLEPDGSFSNYFGQGWGMLPGVYDTVGAVIALDQGEFITAGTTSSSTKMMLVKYMTLFPQVYIPLILFPDS